MIGWFNKNFIRTGAAKKEYGQFVHSLFNKRMEADYEIFVEFTKEEVKELLGMAKEFITDIRELIKK